MNAHKDVNVIGTRYCPSLGLSGTTYILIRKAMPRIHCLPRLNRTVINRGPTVYVCTSLGGLPIGLHYSNMLVGLDA